MSNDDDDVKQLAAYGAGVARLYMWVWICVAYFLTAVGVLGGLLIVNDGSTVFGLCTVAMGLAAWKIAGRLRRFKDQSS